MRAVRRLRYASGPMPLRILAFLAAIASLLAACASSPSRPENTTMAGPKVPYPKANWTRGPAVRPKDALVAWLDQQGPKKLVRLPVTVRFGNGGMGIEGGTAGDLELVLNDSGLGQSLMDHARMASPERTTCTLHLEGRWRGLRDGKGELYLWRVHREVPAGVDYAEVESAP